MARLRGAGARTGGWASADRIASDAGDRGAQHFRGARRDLVTGGPGQLLLALLLREAARLNCVIGSRVLLRRVREWWCAPRRRTCSRCSTPRIIVTAKSGACRRYSRSSAFLPLRAVT